jgi:hypothetical protein
MDVGIFKSDSMILRLGKRLKYELIVSTVLELTPISMSVSTIPYILLSHQDSSKASRASST